MTPKATALRSALELGPAPELVEGAAIPLLNGIDHLATVRAQYPNTVAGAIRVESKRVAPDIRQSSPFLRVELAIAKTSRPSFGQRGSTHVSAPTRSRCSGTSSRFSAVALATAALDGPLGAVRDDARYLRCQDEAIAVARAPGPTSTKPHSCAAQAAPAGMRSSMQKDVAAGRAPELDAIAGPIIRGGEARDSRARDPRARWPRRRAGGLGRVTTGVSPRAGPRAGRSPTGSRRSSRRASSSRRS